MDIKTRSNEIRGEILRLEKMTLELKQAALSARREVAPVPDTAEMAANTMLAYRHLEDARMRLGKVIQAYEGGVSCYDKEKAAA